MKYATSTTANKDARRKSVRHRGSARERVAREDSAAEVADNSISRSEGDTVRPVRGASEKGETRLQVSVHTLALALDCRTRLALRLAGMEDASIPPPSPSISLVAGKWAHTALAAWCNGDDWEAALAPYESISNELSIAGDRRGYPNLRSVMASFAMRHNRDALAFDLLDAKTTEISFVVPLGGVRSRSGADVPVDLIGYIDKLVRDKASGRLMLLEHKTTGKLDEAFVKRFVEYDPQTTAYILGVQTTTGETGDEAWVNAIEVKNVPSSSTKCAKHGVPFAECGPLGDIRDPHVRQTFIRVQRTPARVAEFKARALDISERIVLPVAEAVAKKGVEVAMRTPRDGMFTGACDMCEYKNWCLRTERSHVALTTMLKKGSYDDSRLRSGLTTTTVDGNNEGESK